MASHKRQIFNALSSDVVLLEEFCCRPAGLGDPVHELIPKLICEVREVTESGLLSKAGYKLVDRFVRLRGHLAKNLSFEGRILSNLELAIEHGLGLLVAVRGVRGLSECFEQVVRVHACVMEKKAVLPRLVLPSMFCPAM